MVTMIVANYAFVWDSETDLKQNHNPKPVCLKQTDPYNWQHITVYNNYIQFF